MQMGIPMKKIYLLVVMMFTLLLLPVPVHAAEDSGNDISSEGMSGLLEEYKDQIKEIVGDMDESTVNEVFSFMKEKVKNGELQTKEGVEQAIEEGNKKFGVEVDEKYIQETLELVNTLEEMGFDSASIIEKAESMYQEYGADFVDHTQELVVDAVKDSIGAIIKNAIVDFFKMIGNFFKNLFSNLF